MLNPSHSNLKVSSFIYLKSQNQTTQSLWITKYFTQWYLHVIIMSRDWFDLISKLRLILHNKLLMYGLQGVWSVHASKKYLLNTSLLTSWICSPLCVSKLFICIASKCLDDVRFSISCSRILSWRSWFAAVFLSWEPK